MAWTRFYDLHSGGSQKLEWAIIYIEADESAARLAFGILFDRDPEHITCRCCGADYGVTESDSLEQATGFERNCRWQDGRYIEEHRYCGPCIPLHVFLQSTDVRVVRRGEW